MPLMIRLVRQGPKNNYFYNIVVGNSRRRLRAMPVEKLGEFYPHPDAQREKFTKLDFSRTKYWLGVGAQMSETVQKLFAKAGIVPAMEIYPDVKRTLTMEQSTNPSKTSTVSE
ncbi:hypothetical protein BB560_002825 [Smittium megazygosporum]|uniref:Ribosomal protein S16 n=1 Tax=Smittium megazygosporum TaxID=133381 RepID=A0A2T9ZDQ4_9FUNG|nr:hypothetical protein BB560_002825 [Smittium megazygosporum]